MSAKLTISSLPDFFYRSNPSTCSGQYDPSEIHKVKAGESALKYFVIGCVRPHLLLDVMRNLVFQIRISFEALGKTPALIIH